MTTISLWLTTISFVLLVAAGGGGGGLTTKLPGGELSFIVFGVSDQGEMVVMESVFALDLEHFVYRTVTALLVVVVVVAFGRLFRVVVDGRVDASFGRAPIGHIYAFQIFGRAGSHVPASFGEHWTINGKKRCHATETLGSIA